MSKFISKAAMVIGAVALVATGVGAGIAIAGGTALSAVGSTAALGLSVSTFATVSSVAGLVAKLTAARPKMPNIGSQTSFKADPDGPVPYVIGDTQVGGNIVYWKSHGGNENPYQTLVTVHSACGPIEGYDQTVMDKGDLNFSGGLVGVHKIDGHDRIWQDIQLGATPEAGALVSPVGSPPGWTAASKLPGLAATLITLKYDGKGDHTLVSTPKMAMRGRYVKIYDPRLDSTYPGGSGPCRALDESTYVFSRNGALHGLTWALGRWHSGRRIGGIGAPIDAIDVASFVEAANVADANGWTCDGQIDLARGKWNSLKMMLQAVGAEPVWQGARLACLTRKPRVSLGIIPVSDIVGDATLPQMQTRRDRINTVIPRYRSVDHDYEVVDAGPVAIAAAVAADGDGRTRRIEYALVQCAAGETPDQAAALAYLDAAAAREAGPIVLPLKPRWIGARFGDCWTLPSGMGDLSGKTAIVRERSLDPVKGHPTLTFLTEDMAKYPIALSQTGVPAPTTDPSTPPTFGAPAAEDWTATPVLTTVGSSTFPEIVITGNVADPNATMVIFEFRVSGTTVWTQSSILSPTISTHRIAVTDPSAIYDVAVSYYAGQRLVLSGISFPAPPDVIYDGGDSNT